MSKFKGYFLRFIDPNDKSKYYTLPMRLLVQSKYKIKPNSRTELNAYRDGYNYLRRTTSPNHKTKIEFSTKPYMTQTEKEFFEAGIKIGLLNADQRKYWVEYWNNAMGVNAYETAEFYFSDVDYVPMGVINGELCYESTRYSLTQY